jgi:hypothetical protein
VGSDCVGGRGSVVTSWGRTEVGGEDGGKIGLEGAESSWRREQ